MRDPSPWRSLRYALWLPCYLLAFVLLEHIPFRSYLSTQLPLDSAIPFCEWFVIPYCLWYPLLVGVGLWLLFRHPEAFRRYMAFLALTFFVSEVIWCLFPNAQYLRPEVMPRDNPLTLLISLLYSIDTCTNVFPSVHVVGAVGAALAVRDARREDHLLRGAVGVLAVLICLSTVFIKQHALADVLGGLVLAAVAAVPIYGKSLLPSFAHRHHRRFV